MHEQPVLNDEEWALLLELLQLEERELPVEIRHATGMESRQEMHHRLEMVRSLLARLRVAAAV